MHKLTAFLDVVLPLESVVDPTGILRPGVGARLVQRTRMFAFFGESVESPDKFRFFTDMPDPEEIKKYVKKEGAEIVLGHLTNVFARHRWIGGQEVGEGVGLFAGTHDLARQCIPKWLGKTSAPSGKKTVEPELTAVSGYASDDDIPAALVPCDVGPLETGVEKDEPIPANASADFYAEKKQMALDLVSYNCRAMLLIFVIVNAYMNRGLRTKLYISGERFDHDNDKRAIHDGHKRYRITEAASNRVETDAARAAVERLCNESIWNALPDEDKTLKHRALATMAITKQQGSIIINLKTRHDLFPHVLFNAAIYSSTEDQQRVANLCQCLRCDFAAYWLGEYPGEQFSKEESIVPLHSMAEDIRTEATNSENGHAYWQQACRLRSTCTNHDTLETVSSDSLFSQNRRFEAELAVTPESKLLGRKPKPECRKTRKQKKQSKPNAKPKKKVGRFGIVAARHGGWGPYRLFVRLNKREGIFGGEQFTGLKEKYAHFKTTPDFVAFARLARSMTHARAADATYTPTDVRGLDHRLANVCPASRTSALAIKQVDACVGAAAHSDSSATALVALSGATSERLATVVKHSSTSAASTLIRSLVRKAGIESRRIKRVGDLALVDWTIKNTDAFKCEIFQNSVPVAGVEAKPSGTSALTRVLWKLPSAQLAAQMAKGMKEPRTEILKDDVSGAWRRLASHEVVRARWAARHKRWVHANVPHLGAVRPSKHMSSLSRQCGMCLCGMHGLVAFRSAFVGLLRRLFSKGADNRYKQSFERNSAVLRIDWRNVTSTLDDDPEVTPYIIISIGFI